MRTTANSYGISIDLCWERNRVPFNGWYETRKYWVKSKYMVILKLADSPNYVVVPFFNIQPAQDWLDMGDATVDLFVPVGFPPFAAYEATVLKPSMVVSRYGKPEPIWKIYASLIQSTYFSF
jgi:hypothetical protein